MTSSWTDASAAQRCPLVRGWGARVEKLASDLRPASRDFRVKSDSIVTLGQAPEGLQQPGYVTRDLIDLEVNPGTDPQRTERGDGPGVRNNVHAEAVDVGLVDREAHA